MHPKHNRVLAVSPSTRGLGFAVFEGVDSFIDWGIKSVKKDKNPECLKKLGLLVDQYRPGVLVLQDHSIGLSRRPERIKALGVEIVALASNRNLKVMLYTREKMREIIAANKKGTKQEIAEILAKRFPEELHSRLPPKRRAWMNENYSMDIFDAVALALTYFHTRRGAKPFRVPTPEAG
jgi:Holliday junction resolvasome RuvABC endonuclease subunit